MGFTVHGEEGQTRKSLRDCSREEPVDLIKKETDPGKKNYSLFEKGNVSDMIEKKRASDAKEKSKYSRGFLERREYLLRRQKRGEKSNPGSRGTVNLMATGGVFHGEEKIEEKEFLELTKEDERGGSKKACRAGGAALGYLLSENFENLGR